MKASDYKKLASAKRAEGAVFDVTVPSGAVWKMREPPVEQFVIADKLPASLATKMAAAVKGQANGSLDESQLLNDLTVDDLMSTLTLGRDLLLFCAIEPRIALNPTSDEEIAPEDILPEDFKFLAAWVISGGRSGEGLSTFRSE